MTKHPHVVTLTGIKSFRALADALLAMEKIDAALPLTAEVTFTDTGAATFTVQAKGAEIAAALSRFDEVMFVGICPDDWPVSHGGGNEHQQHLCAASAG